MNLFLSEIEIDKGLSTYYVSSYNKAGSVRMLMNARVHSKVYVL